jgi:hypothetical protein
MVLVPKVQNLLHLKFIQKIECHVHLGTGYVGLTSKYFFFLRDLNKKLLRLGILCYRVGILCYTSI